MHAHTETHTGTHTETHRHTHWHTHTHARTHARTLHTHTHTHFTHTHTHAHIYIYEWSRFPNLGQKTLVQLIFNLCAEFRWSPEGSVSQIHSAHLHVGAPVIIWDLLRSVQILKREWCTESNGKLPNLFIPCKTAALVPKFAVENLPLGRTAALVPEFVVKDHCDDIYVYDSVLNNNSNEQKFPYKSQNKCVI